MKKLTLLLALLGLTLFPSIGSAQWVSPGDVIVQSPFHIVLGSPDSKGVYFYQSAPNKATLKGSLDIVGTLTCNGTSCGGGGGGTPGTPALSIQGASADGTTFVGIAGTSFDPTANGGIVFDTTALGTGDGKFEVLAGAEIHLIAQGGDGAVISSVGTGPAVLDATQGTGYVAIQGSNGTYVLSNSTTDDLEIDAVGADIGGGGTKAIRLTSAGGILGLDNSAAGISLIEVGAGVAEIGTPDVVFRATEATGAIIVSLVSQMDLDQTVSGVITASTILNAVGGYQANGVAGISEVCTVIPTGITISFGIITAIAGGTCTP